MEHASRSQDAYDSIKAFSETDFTEDLKKFDVPTLVMHGEDDQIVPVKDSAKKSALYGNEDLLAQSQTAVTTNLIALYKALGGGGNHFPNNKALGTLGIWVP